MSHGVMSANGSYDKKHIFSRFVVDAVVVGGSFVGGGGHSFEAGRLSNFPPNRIGVYSRWVLI